jgi:hypothetical protein
MPHRVTPLWLLLLLLLSWQQWRQCRRLAAPKRGWFLAVEA